MADSKLTALTEISVPGLVPGGRLTLTTGVPVTSADVTAARTLHYTPYVHPYVRVWDGTRWLLAALRNVAV